MSDLESIVPPLDLCKQIPPGNFYNSALAWFVPADTDFPEYGDPSVIIRNYAWAATSERGIYPAPTLQEIMEALIKKGCWEPTLKYLSAQGVWEVDYTGFLGYEITEKSPVEAALKFWLNLA